MQSKLKVTTRLQSLEQLKVSCICMYWFTIKVTSNLTRIWIIVTIEKEQGFAPQCAHLSSEFLDVPAALWGMHWQLLKKILPRTEDMQQGSEIIGL